MHYFSSKFIYLVFTKKIHIFSSAKDVEGRKPLILLGDDKQLGQKENEKGLLRSEDKQNDKLPCSIFFILICSLFLFSMTEGLKMYMLGVSICASVLEELRK